MSKGLRGPVLPVCPLLDYQAAGVPQPMVLSWFLLWHPRCRLCVSPAVAFLKSIFMNVCFNREN